MMRGFGGLSTAMMRGFLRDRSAFFFTVLFPLMFLVLFGGLLKTSGVSRTEILQAGPVPIIDTLPSDARAELGELLKIEQRSDITKAMEEVRRGDFAAVIEQRGDRLVVHYSAADQVRAGTVRSVLAAVVDGANQAVTGMTPKFSLDSERVEDKSLKTIQFMTPGLLGWAIATGATFGAALTLVTWRQKKILRRLRLAPISLSSVVGARIWVSVLIALVQTAIFLGVAVFPYFGLQLSAYWWMAFPLVAAGTLAFLSIGMFAGAWAKTPETASAIVNLVVLPMAFLSGSFFPLDDAPSWLRTLSEVFPLKHLNDAMLDVLVRDRAPDAVLPEIGLLLGFAVVVSALAARLFRWDDV